LARRARFGNIIFDKFRCLRIGFITFETAAAENIYATHAFFLKKAVAPKKEGLRVFNGAKSANESLTGGT